VVRGQTGSSLASQVTRMDPRLSRPTGYVELPYTLPQDFSMFILMQEKTIDIWKQKVDWIADNRGMALLDVHPDYLGFNGDHSQEGTYPAQHYRDFLDYVRTRYRGSYWHALPREVAEFVVRP
jgi:hypothetical protein